MLAVCVQTAHGPRGTDAAKSEQQTTRCDMEWKMILAVFTQRRAKSHAAKSGPPIAANRKGFRLTVCVPVQKGVHAERVGKQAHGDIPLKIVDMVAHKRIIKWPRATAPVKSEGLKPVFFAALSVDAVRASVLARERQHPPCSGSDGVNRSHTIFGQLHSSAFPS